MDPGALLRPVGPHPAWVYWMRRAVPLLLVLAVVVALSRACGADPVGSGRPTTGSTGSPSPTASASPTATRSAAAASGTCPRSRLSVTAATDADSYGAGIAPRLRMTVTVSGPRACSVDDSAGNRSWEVWSGNDRVFTTADCPTPPPAHRVRLRPGRSVSHVLVWDRHRAARGCSAPGAAVRPGTYRVYVTLAGARSAAAVFHLTG